MTVSATLSPVEATTKAVDALLAALAGNPGPGAVAAYRSALTRQGRQLVATAGPEGLAAALAKVRADAADKAQADEREQIVREAWQGIATTKDAAVRCSA